MENVLVGLLSELQKDVKQMSDRVSRNDETLKTLIGNGQPGRITILEKNIEELNKFKWKLAGVGAVLIAMMEVMHVLLEGGFKFIR